MIYEDWLPHYLVCGVSEDKFWVSSPKDLMPYDRAQEMRLKEEDERMWRNGYYMRVAMVDAISVCFSGKKSSHKSIYPDKPMLKEAFEKAHMTQEEIDRMEIEKMIANEKMWQARGIAKGLPTSL